MPGQGPAIVQCPHHWHLPAQHGEGSQVKVVAVQIVCVNDIRLPIAKRHKIVEILDTPDVV